LSTPRPLVALIASLAVLLAGVLGQQRATGAPLADVLGGTPALWLLLLVPVLAAAVVRMDALARDHAQAHARASDELQRAANRLAGLTVALDQPLVVVSAEDTILACNGPALELLGLRPDAALTLPAATVLPDLPAREPPTDRTAMQARPCAFRVGGEQPAIAAAVVDLPDGVRIVLGRRT